MKLKRLFTKTAKTYSEKAAGFWAIGCCERRNGFSWAILNLRFHYIYQGISVPVVEIDERGSMTVPRELGLRKSRALIIPAGSFFITIPLPKTPQKEAEKWLPASKEHRELRVQAEKIAGADAVKRAKRRHQL